MYLHPRVIAALVSTLMVQKCGKCGTKMISIHKAKRNVTASGHQKFQQLAFGLLLHSARVQTSTRHTLNTITQNLQKKTLKCGQMWINVVHCDGKGTQKSVQTSIIIIYIHLYSDILTLTSQTIEILLEMSLKAPNSAAIMHYHNCQAAF